MFWLLSASLAQAESPSGAHIFISVCAACHGERALGTPGLAPPLARSSLANGKLQVVQTVLFGLTGPIAVAGETYDSAMPSFSNFTDDEIAAVANYVIGFGAATPIGPKAAVIARDVEIARRLDLTQSQVHANRQAAFTDATPLP